MASSTCLSIVVPAPSQPTVLDDPKNDIILRSSDKKNFPF